MCLVIFSFENCEQFRPSPTYYPYEYLDIIGAKQEHSVGTVENNFANFVSSI